MRLQLIVQRHSLPPVQVLWTVGVLRPPYAAAGTSATVSQLLEQINEIIPLESGDWGLEDYAVEVRGFECLHFSELSQVLKEDDEVCIRPLQSSDLRFRKVSGRHQISADGRHLIDGVAFGRPFLRRPDRPAIRIPPRKRRRVTYDEDDDTDFGANFHDRQVILRTGLNDEDHSLDSDEEDDRDFTPDEDKENALDTELQDIYNDLGDDSARALTTEITTNVNGLEEPPGRLTRAQKAKRGLGLQGAAMLELVDENGRPYPGEYNNPLLDQFGKDEPAHLNHEITKRKKNKQNIHHRHGKGQAAEHVYQGTPERASRRSSSASMKSVRFEDPDSTTPATIRVNHQGFEPAIDIAVDPDESDKENSQPQFEAYQPNVSPSITTSSSSSSSSELEYDEEETSSSGSSSADDSSDSGPERHPTSSVRHIHSDNSSRTSSSIINSDSEADKPAESSNGNGVAVNTDSPALAALAWKNSKTATQANAQQVQDSSLPYKGKHQTQKRNQRRRDSKRMKHLKDIGVLPNNATWMEFRRLKGDENRVNGVPEELREESQNNAIKLGADLELRRDALLEAITSGGLEASPDVGLEDAPASVSVNDASIKCDAATTEDIENRLIDEQPKDMPDVGKSANPEPDAATAVTENPPLTDQVSLGSSKRASKLDLASSRRLLFGSLGLPAPKNKQDELNIKEQLMKNVTRRTHSESRIEVEAEGPFTADEPEENEQWKDKIVLKAVECCYDDIELSTPPFPFVQRWDPQQQGGGYEGLKKGRTSQRDKKRKRNDEKFYQQVPIHRLEDGKSNANTAAPGMEDHLHENVLHLPVQQQQQQITSRRESDEYEGAINDQINRETDASASASTGNGIIQDLPMLPVDMSICTPLTKKACLPGAIVAFKQLDMSQETNWQPKVSGYRTALVEHLMENGIIRMTLAQRDQPQVQKSYNQQTGERIYSKFEMPGFNDDEFLENGIVELSFAELIEPKLISVTSVEPLVMEDQQSSTRGGGFPYEVITGERSDISLMDYNKASPKLPNSSVNGSNTNGGREEVRNEIFDLIKDAGWRSSLRSNFDQEKGPGGQLSPSDQADKEQELVDPISPKFLGFSSSPLTGGRIRARSELSYNSAGPTPDSVSLPRPANILEVAESLPYQRITGPESPLKRMSSYGDEDLDIKAEDADENPFMDEPQRKSGLPEADHQVSSRQLGSSKSPYQPVSSKSVPSKSVPSKSVPSKSVPSKSVPSKSVPSKSVPSKSVSSHRLDFQHDPPAKEVIPTNGPESDDFDFPTVEEVFSQMRSSYERSSDEMEDLTYREGSSFETLISKDEPISSSEVPKVKPDGKKNSSGKQTCFKSDESDGEEDEITPHASQVPMQSQVVDLTISSDHVDPDDSDYVDYGTQLPSGPGWVQKKKASGRYFSTAETSNPRSRLTRSASYQACS
ncbi:hypothetical protein MMC29_001712 [Sticta canariensis]|nr:hypothetical protein [Sticta canariensis]